jgi:hypothetical protein
MDERRLIRSHTQARIKRWLSAPFDREELRMPTNNVQQAPSGHRAPRWAMPCFVLWGLGACGQDTVVEVSVMGLSPVVNLLQVNAACSHGSGPSCNGGQWPQVDFHQNLNTFYVTIPASMGGTLTLDVEAQSRRPDQMMYVCGISSAHREVPLTSSFVPIDLELKSEPLTLTDFSPAYGFATGGIDVTLSGQGFTSNTVVKFDSIEANVSQVSDCQLTAILPPHQQITEVEAVVLVESSKMHPMQTASAPSKFLYRR